MLSPATTDLEPERQFWEEFLDIYCSQPYLRANFPRISRESYYIERANSLAILVKHYQTRYPNSTIDMVKRKIYNFRCGFHREYRKKMRLEELGFKHKPILWYYSKMLAMFIERNLQLASSGTASVSDEDEVVLPVIKANKQYPGKRKRIETIKKETYEIVGTDTSSSKRQKLSLNSKSGQDSSIYDDDSAWNCSVSSELMENNENQIQIENKSLNQNRKDQQQQQHDVVTLDDDTDDDFEKLTEFSSQSSNIIYTNSSWNIHNNDNVQHSPHNPNHFNDNNCNEDCDETSNNEQLNFHYKRITADDILNLADRAITSIQNIPINNNSQIHDNENDIYEIIGQKFGQDLKEMTLTQRIIAEKIISEIVFYGQTNLLDIHYNFKPSI